MTEQEAHQSQKRSVWPWIIAALGLAVVGAVGAVFLRGGTSFAELVEVTERAEGDQIWVDYFVAQDCFFVALAEAGDIELGYEESQDLLTQTDGLARHVDLSLESFDDLRFLPWQSQLTEAREAIVAHYQVWDDHLTDTTAVLSVINSEPSSVVEGFQSFVTLVTEALDPIESTFNEAGEVFREVAGEDSTLLGGLFEPADVSCTRTAI